MNPVRHQEREPAPPDPVALQAMRLLDASPRHSQREIARELGLSLGKANYVLRALLQKGFVKARSFSRSPRKAGYMYLLTPAGVAAKADLSRRFLQLKLREYESLRAEIERLREDCAAAPPAANRKVHRRRRGASPQEST